MHCIRLPFLADKTTNMAMPAVFGAAQFCVTSCHPAEADFTAIKVQTLLRVESLPANPTRRASLPENLV